MLHIILFILKILGWILLAILGLLVLLVCIVFFVPLRYRAEGRCKGTLDSLYGKIRFSWLLHLVSGSAVYDGGKLMWTIRIAWKKLYGGMEEEWEEEEAPAGAVMHTEEEDLKALEELLDGGEKQQQESRKEELPEKNLPEKDSLAENSPQKNPPEENLPNENLQGKKNPDKITEGEENQEAAEKAASAENRTVSKKIPADQNANSEKTGSASKIENTESEKEGIASKIKKKCQKSSKWIQGIYNKIKYTFEKICDTIKTLLEKKDKLLEFIEDEIHRSAFFTALKELRRLLRFLKPKRVEADLHFGFEDPSITGKVLGLISMIYPFLGEHTNIQPDFEQKILEGNIAISGKLRVLYVVIMGWNLIWNKNVRTTFRHIRKFEL